LVEDCVAVVTADGRACPARPVAGGGLGSVAGPSVLVRCEGEVLCALDWMPGRILVVAEAALDPGALSLLVRSAHRTSVAGLVLLVENPVDLRALVEVEGVVPVVSVERASDQRFVRRAVRLKVDVQSGSSPSVDLRPRHQGSRGHRTGVAIQLGEPGMIND
jgi:hypothetical protein